MTLPSLVSRRTLLQAASTVLPIKALGLSAALLGLEALASENPAYAADHMPVADIFPTQPPELVREMVTVSHFDLKRVKELV